MTGPDRTRNQSLMESFVLKPATDPLVLAAPATPPATRRAEHASFALSNGIPVHLVENHDQPYVSVQVVLRSGARDDGALPGLAAFTCDIVSCGAGDRDAESFADDVDFMGASLSADTGRDDIVIHLGLLKRFLPDGLDAMADMILRPHVDPEEVDRERLQNLASLKQNLSEPDYLAEVRLRNEIHGGTPYGREVDGDERSIERIAAADIAGFHARHFTAGNAFVVASGDVGRDELHDLLDDRFAGWSGPRAERDAFVTPPPPSAPRFVVVHRPGSAHTALRIGRVGIRRRDPDYSALRALNTLFGDYFNCRLNQTLRERLGYTYGAWSHVDAPIDPGSIVIGASVRHDRVGATVEKTFEELRKISSEPVEPDERDMAIRYIVGHQALRLETPDQVAGLVRGIALHELPDDWYTQRMAETQSLTRERLLEVAARYFRPETMTVVLAGDAELIVPDLTVIGATDVRIVDRDGSAIGG